MRLFFRFIAEVRAWRLPGLHSARAGITRDLGLRDPLESQRGYHVTVMAPEYNLMVNPMASTGREVAHLVAVRNPQVDQVPFRAERFRA